MRRRGAGVLVLLLSTVVAAGSASGQSPPARQPVPLREAPIAEGRRMLTVQGERYGTLVDDHPIVVKVRGIFQKIARAAGRRPGLVLDLHVLDTSRVIAEALPGGVVVVSRGFVELARFEDDAIAFALGHEVAHLTRDHHGLLDALGVLGAGPAEGPAKTGLPEGASSAERMRAHRAMELEADRLGVLFATLAGYRPSAALPLLGTLFERTGPDPLHPQPAARARVVREQVEDVVRHLEVLRLGLFLLATGRYLQAARVLEQFLALFPGREVLSVIGVAYHKEALRFAPEPEFHHLLVIDGSTRAAPPKSATPHPAFKRFMEQAVHYYTLAVDTDPTYAPALNNLGTAYLDLGEPELALGYIDRALREDSRLAAAHNNRGILSAAAGEHRRAEEAWLLAAELEPGLRAPAHNLARLYELAGRGDAAQRWRGRIPASDGEARGQVPESIGAVTPGSSVSRYHDWLAEPGVRRINVPLGGKAEDDFALFVLSKRGIVLATRRNVVEAVGTIGTERPATSRGVRPGDPGALIEATYGRPDGTDGLQAISAWAYFRRALVVFMTAGRVQGIWTGRGPATGK